MRILLAGASGLIGRALMPALAADGHELVQLVRRPAASPQEVSWDPTRPLDGAALGQVDAAINLAGAGVGDKRWTTSYKQVLRDSRVVTTRTLATALAGLPTPPGVLLNASAIGWYGDTGDVAVDESAPRGDGFLAQMCEEWEAATSAASEAGIRVVHLRTGLVVAGNGGAWQRLIPLFKLGVGGRLAGGRQYWSWISIDDEIGAIGHCLTTASLSGPVNLTAPEPLPNAEITRVMGEVLGRPTPFPVPGAALRAVLGEFSVETLSSQRVLPAKLLGSGYRFRYPDFASAFSAALAA